MTKTTGKTAETIEFPTFDATKASDQFRAFTEKGVEQTREGYAKMKAGAEEAQKAIETTYEQAKTAGDSIALKSIAAMRDNTEANFSHLEALVGAKSLSEVFELQTSFLRGRVESGIEQAKDFQTASQKAADDMAKPFKDAFEKSLKDMKAA